MTEELLQHQNNGIVTLTLNRPQLRNSISSPTLIDALINAFDRINADKSVKVVILTGAGKAFCSGGDLNNMHRLLDARAADPLSTVDYYVAGIQRVARALDNLEVPIIAAVNGAAIGGGLDLACMCDMRYAAASAKFAENYVRLGLIAGTGGFWFLPRIVGYAKACELALTGNMFNAEQALEIGLVARVCADEDLLPAVNTLAASIAANPVEALRMAKRLMKDSERTSLREHLGTVTMMQSLLHTGTHHREAVTAFVEKIKPV
jgi:enoyl-CoA hydratase/carnithine racemase